MFPCTPARERGYPFSRLTIKKPGVEVFSIPEYPVIDFHKINISYLPKPSSQQEISDLTAEIERLNGIIEELKDKILEMGEHRGL